MSERSHPTSEEREPAATTHVSGGVNLGTGGDTSIGGDVVGRDKVTQTTTITQVGMSPEAVRRLVITVGVLVFVTAFCFFSGGLVVGFTALNALGRGVSLGQDKAAAFQAKLNDVNARKPGEPVGLNFSEEQLNSYMRFVLGPKIGLQNDSGRARFLPAGEVAFYGQWSGLLGLQVIVVTRIETDSPALYHAQSAAVRLFGDEGSSFGVVAIPNSAVQPLVDAINAEIGRRIVAKEISYPTFVLSPEGSGSSGPAPGTVLMIDGLAQ